MYLSTVIYKRNDGLSIDDENLRQSFSSIIETPDARANYLTLIQDYIAMGKLLFCNNKKSSDEMEKRYTKLWDKEESYEEFRAEAIRKGCPVIEDIDSDKLKDHSVSVERETL